MQKNRYKLPVHLDDPDVQLLRGIVEATGATSVQVIRWALRYYALRGPWTASKRERIQRFGAMQDLDVGPKMEGIS